MNELFLIKIKFYVGLDEIEKQIFIFNRCKINIIISKINLIIYLYYSLLGLIDKSTNNKKNDLFCYFYLNK